MKPYELKLKLDELRPFRGPEGTFLDVIVYGEVWLTYDATCEWDLDWVSIDTTSNVGGTYVVGKCEIDRAHILWAPIELALRTSERDYVRMKILDALGVFDAALDRELSKADDR